MGIRRRDAINSKTKVCPALSWVRIVRVLFLDDTDQILDGDGALRRLLSH